MSNLSKLEKRLIIVLIATLFLFGSSYNSLTSKYNELNEAHTMLQAQYVSLDTEMKNLENTQSNSAQVRPYYVWCSRTGDKYHINADCGNMNKPTMVTEREAIARGRTKCSTCYS